MSKNLTKETAESNEQIDSIRAKASNLDDKVKRGEMSMKHNNISDNIERGGKIEETYVDAIKAKINLLNNFH